jgi:hypothetical protein
MLEVTLYSSKARGRYSLYRHSMKEEIYLVSSRNSNTDLKKNKSSPADVLDLSRSSTVTALFGLPMRSFLSGYLRALRNAGHTSTALETSSGRHLFSYETKCLVSLLKSLKLNF